MIQGFKSHTHAHHISQCTVLGEYKANMLYSPVGRDNGQGFGSFGNRYSRR
jgi:hypothetical protein